MTDEPQARPRGHRFRVRRFRPGYAVDDVDDLVDRVAVALDGGALGEPLRADDVRKARLASTRFTEGYDEDEVDRYLDQAAQWLDRVAPPGEATDE